MPSVFYLALATEPALPDIVTCIMLCSLYFTPYLEHYRQVVIDLSLYMPCIVSDYPSLKSDEKKKILVDLRTRDITP